MLDQQNRIGRLTTPLGANALCLVELTANEGLSQLFDFEVIAVSENRDIDFDSLIGKPCSIEVDAAGAGKRNYHGLLTEGEWMQEADDLSYYRLRLQPWCWLLTKTADCRIHHNKSVVDIIKATFADHGLTDYTSLLSYSYDSLEYTVQYCESDWNFVCRLMELSGIYYFFQHSADKHQLILADGLGAHAAQGEAQAIQYNPSDAEALLAMRTPYVSRWSLRRKLRSGKFEITDYNHLTPTAKQLANRPLPHPYSNGDFEVFDWPGPHTNREQGETYVRILAEAEEAQDKRRVASGVAASLYPGVLATLSQHPRAGENGQYVTVGMQSHLGPQTYATGATAQSDGGFTAHFDFLPSSIPFRAPLETPVPTIPSLQTATVVGAPGEEIDCDDHGRILVHFFWDRHSDKSCRVRVNQVWGGQGWGAQVIPRVGMEVMVAFVDGNPDRPLVVGCVANPKTLKTPYELPANKTRMVWRSATYKGSGANELTFEDATNGQLFYMHAEKDMHALVRHNQSTQVEGPQRTIRVTTGDEHKSIDKGNLTEFIKEKHSAEAKIVTVYARDHISHAAVDHIQLSVGDNGILIDKEKIVIQVGAGTHITLTKDVIDQIAPLIQLNKDKA